MYDGSAFRGFQRQPGLPSVQAEIERALEPLGLSGRIDAAARTDAGVHAVDQVVSITAPAGLDPAAVRSALNAASPESLVCLDAAPVDRSFHARFSATG